MVRLFCSKPSITPRPPPPPVEQEAIPFIIPRQLTLYGLRVCQAGPGFELPRARRTHSHFSLFLFCFLQIKLVDFYNMNRHFFICFCRFHIFCLFFVFFFHKIKLVDSVMLLLRIVFHSSVVAVSIFFFSRYFSVFLFSFFFFTNKSGNMNSN